MVLLLNKTKNLESDVLDDGLDNRLGNAVLGRRMKDASLGRLGPGL